VHAKAPMGHKALPNGAGMKSGPKHESDRFP
jgi:hypothetical protein